MEKTVLTTQRLILRPLEMTDAPWIQEKFNDWEIIKHLASFVSWPYPDDGAETFLKDIALPQIENGEAIHWAITLKESGEGIGVITFRYKTDEFDGNRGFWIARAHQGKGYVTEAVAAVNDYIFDVLKLDKFEVQNATANKASRRVKEKTGARFVGTKMNKFNFGEAETEIWEVTREAWQAIREG